MCGQTNYDSETAFAAYCDCRDDVPAGKAGGSLLSVSENYVVRACMEQGYRVSYLAESEGNYQALENELLDGILAIGIFQRTRLHRWPVLLSRLYL